MKHLLLIACLFCSGWIQAQTKTYEQQIAAHRDAYKQAFLDEENSPLEKQDLPFLDFYPANSSYLVTATFTRIEDSIGFDMKTHSGKLKPYVVYGKLEFELQGNLQQLFLYQSVTLRTQKGLEDYLFVPFTDLTSGNETYGGGRYLDFSMKDIFSNKLILDFNKAYNPYCAYKGGYSCPIPPKENFLNLKVEAGEKRFRHEPAD